MTSTELYSIRSPTTGVLITFSLQLRFLWRTISPPCWNSSKLKLKLMYCIALIALRLLVSFSISSQAALGLRSSVSAFLVIYYAEWREYYVLNFVGRPECQRLWKGKQRWRKSIGLPESWACLRPDSMCRNVRNKRSTGRSESNCEGHTTSTLSEGFRNWKVWAKYLTLLWRRS